MNSLALFILYAYRQKDVKINEIKIYFICSKNTDATGTG